MEWVTNTLYKIVLWIDSIVYRGAAGCYNLFIKVANLNNTISEAELVAPISEIITRIQILIGVFMLFRLSFILIQYLIDPDKIKDNKNGTKIVTNIFVSIILLTASNFIFQLFSDFQSSFFTDNNVIARIVFGTDNDKNYTNDKAGTFVSNQMFLSFFYYSGGRYDTTQNLFSDVDKECVNTADSQECLDNIIGGLSGAERAIFIVSTGTADINSLTDYIDNSNVRYEYPLISTATGIIMIILFFSFTIEIGIRFFKLLFLQLIAPIPILSYMDPKGQDIFWNYAKFYMSTFVELFVRVSVIYIAISLVQVVMNVTVGDFGGVLIKVVLALSLFYFAKTLPDIIKKIFNLDFNVGTKGRSFLGALAGFGLGSALGVGKGLLNGMPLGALAAGVSGGLRGATSGARAKGLIAFTKGQADATAKTSKSLSNMRNSGGFLPYMGGLLDNKLGLTDRMDRRISETEANVSRLKNIEDSSVKDFANTYRCDSNGNAILDANGNKQKVGTIDEDTDVIVARSNLSILQREGKAAYEAKHQKSDPSYQQAILAAQNDVRSAESNYNNMRKEWFNGLNNAKKTDRRYYDDNGLFMATATKRALNDFNRNVPRDNKIFSDKKPEGIKASERLDDNKKYFDKMQTLADDEKVSRKYKRRHYNDNQ